MRLLTKIILASVAALAVVVGVIAGIGLYVINDVSIRSDLRVLRSELNAVILDLKDDDAGPSGSMTDQRIVSELMDFANSTGQSYFAVRPDGKRLVTRPEAANEFSDDTFQRMIRTGNGSGWFETPASRYLVHYALLSNPDVLIGVRMTEDAVFEDRINYLTAIGAAAILMLLAGSVFAVFHGRALTRRIGTTLTALDRINQGEFGIRIAGTDASDELSAIQRRINDLADSFARRATEREAAVKWLEENEKRFRDFAEAASDAFWETDENLVYTFFANPGQDFGYLHESGSIIGTRRGSYLGDPDVYAPGWADHMHDLETHKVVKRFDFSGVYPDGTVFHRISSAIPLFDPDGKFTGYRGTTTDFTHLIEAERRLESVVSNLPGLVYQRLVSPDGSVEYGFLGGDLETLFGTGEPNPEIVDVKALSRIHPDDRERFRAAMLESARSGKPYEQEFRHIKPDGETLWLKTICGQPVTRPDGVVVQDGLTFDITELKAAEQEARTAEARLNDFLQAGYDILWETDPEHRLTWMSDPADDQIRYVSTSDMIGKRRWEYPGAMPLESGAWDQLISALEERKAFRDFEFESRLPDKRSAFRRVSGRPMFGENGDFIGYRGISTDITRMVEQAREAIARQTQLTDAIESSGQGVALFGPDDRLVFANEACLGLDAGFSEIFVPGRSFEEIVRKAVALGDFPAAAGDEENWVQKRLAYHASPEGPFGTVLQGDRYLEISDERLSDGSAITRMTDVTDYILSRDALRASEERFRDFAESTSDWMWETDTEHRITWVSESVQQYSDIGIATMLGKTRWDSLGVDIENDAHWRQLRNTMDAEEPIREFRYSRINVEDNHLHRIINGVPFYDEHGVFLGYRGVVADTTALMEAEQAEKRFLEAINTANEGLILFDAEDCLVFANHRARELLNADEHGMKPGITLEQMLRQFLSPLANDRTKEDWEDWLQIRLAQHRNMDEGSPIITRRKDGTVVETREEVLPDESCIVFLNDITDRVKAEEALLASQQRFKDFTEASSDWVWETDADFRMTFAAGGEGGESELDPNSFLGKTRWDYYGVDVENNENWRGHLEDMLAHRPFRDFRYSRVRSDGLIIHRSVSGVPFYDPTDGSFLGYRGTTADITEQVESELRYRNLIEQSPAPVIVHRDEAILFANAAALDMFGARSMAELSEHSVYDLIHPDEKELFQQRMTAIMEDGEVTELVEQKRLRIDGSEIVVVTRGVPVIWEGERAVLGSLLDVTDRVQAERQYRQLIEDAPIALTIDDGRKFLMVNQAFADLSRGGDPKDIVGVEIDRMSHPDDLDVFHDRVQRVVNLRQPLQTAQLRRKRFDGTEITVLSRGVPIQWEGRPATLGIQVDVSDRIAAQQALKDSEERFRNLVEGSRQGVLLHADFKPVFANEALAEIFGYDDATDILDLPSVLDLVAPEARETWRRNREARLAGLDVEDNYEFAGLHKSGKQIWIHMSVRVVSWQDRTAIQGTMIDITRRRDAEMRIRESEEQFRLLTSTSPVGIFVATAEGDCEYVNETYENLSGRPLSLTMGRGWAEAIHPEDRERVVSAWFDAVESDSDFKIDLRYLRPDGSTAWAIAQAVAQRDPLGKPVRFIGAVTNVTDRVQAEIARQESDERFRLLTTLSPVGVFMTNAAGLLEYVNDSLSEMLGMPAEETYGNGWMKGIHPDDREELLSIWKTAFRDRTTLEMEFRMGNGTDDGRWVFVQASPLTSGGNRSGYIGAVTDITDRRLAEEQLRQVQKMDAVGQLTGGIAHDFNNLLAIVQGNLELLRERAPEEERITNLVEAAYGAAQRGAALNQRLLAFARRQPLRPSVCDINEIVDDMAGLFERTLGDNIELRTQFAEGLWTTDIDPNGLETAVLNLAINARDAMPDGGTLTISTANSVYDRERPAPDPDLPSGSYVVLKVSDTGTGMDAETLEKAFDPFYTTKGMGKGSGLGLSMVYGFARQSKGTAVVESLPGEGTSITLLFPRESGDIDAETVTRGDTEPVPPGDGECILIVEDDEDVRDMAIGMFESLNYRTLVAGSANEAMNILRDRQDIELLFTDVMLGTGDDGPALARKARQADPGLRVLFASGYVGAGLDDDNSIELGALINKPYARADLARAVRTALETGRA
ncbi:MAG: PAS domain S-box protein [Alphaproteobacteria bacterium]